MKSSKFNLDKYYQERDYLNFADYIVEQFKQSEDSNIGIAKLTKFGTMVYKTDRPDLLRDLHYLSRSGECYLEESNRDILFYNSYADEVFMWFFNHWCYGNK